MKVISNDRILFESTMFSLWKKQRSLEYKNGKPVQMLYFSNNARVAE